MACLLPLARLSISTKPLTRQMGLLPYLGASFFQQKRLAALAEPGRDRGGHSPPRYDRDNSSIVKCRPWRDGLYRLIQRAANGQSSSIEHVGVDHGCVHIFVPEQFLHRVDVIAFF